MGQNQNDRNATKEKALRNAMPEHANREQISSTDAGTGDERTSGIVPNPNPDPRKS